jgi:hypothetical protein
MLTIGYPQEGYKNGPVKRLPVEQVTFLNTMAIPWPKK